MAIDKITSSARLPSKGSEEYWQIQSDADTLIRAQEIQSDKKRIELATLLLKERADAAKAALTKAQKSVSN